MLRAPPLFPFTIFSINLTFMAHFGPIFLSDIICLVKYLSTYYQDLDSSRPNFSLNVLYSNFRMILHHTGQCVAQCSSFVPLHLASKKTRAIQFGHVCSSFEHPGCAYKSREMAVWYTVHAGGFTSFVLQAGHPGLGQIAPMRSHRRN